MQSLPWFIVINSRVSGTSHSRAIVNKPTDRKMATVSLLFITMGDGGVGVNIVYHNISIITYHRTFSLGNDPTQKWNISIWQDPRIEASGELAPHYSTLPNTLPWWVKHTQYSTFWHNCQHLKENILFLPKTYSSCNSMVKYTFL